MRDLARGAAAPRSRRAAFLLLPLLCACSFDASQRWRSAPRPSLSVKMEYRARPGDKVTVTFLRRLRDTSAAAAYRLQRGDEVRLSVQDREDLAGVSAVAPDGNLYLPYLEPLPAEGRTLADLRQAVEEKYQPMVKSARVTLVPVRFAAQVEALLQGLSAPGRPGSAYQASISLDGSAAFPHLGRLPMAGNTSREAAALLQARYLEALPGVEVVAELESGASRLLTVLGEMRRPGAFPVEGPVSLTTALGLAEGWLPSARLRDIVLVQRSGDEVVIGKYDLQDDLLTAAQLQVAGGDLVFVPRTAITDLNLFVDQYLRRNLPVPVGLTVPFPGL